MSKGSDLLYGILEDRTNVESMSWPRSKNSDLGRSTQKSHSLEVLPIGLC